VYRERGEKICPDCERVLPFAEFHCARRWRRDGTSYLYPSGYCKECTLKRQKASRQRVKQMKAEYKERMRLELEGYEVEKLGPPVGDAESEA
jgi:hypothetical protein